MRAVELVAHLHSQGATVALEGADLRVRAPAHVLTDEIRELLLARKREIIRLLSSFSCVKCGRFAFPDPDTVCFYCRPRLPDSAGDAREESLYRDLRMRR